MNTTIRIVVLATVFVLATVSLAFADEDALEIIREVERRQSTETSKAELSMLVYPDAGDTGNVREFKVISYGRGEEDSYMQFIEPRSIKGLSILSRGGDQWVYFSSTGRVRKIAGKSKKQSVSGVGGDFSYEDLSAGNWEEKYDFRVLKQEPRQWVLEGTPKGKDSVYSRILISIDRQRYLATKIEYYTEEEGHYKDLEMSEIKELGGREVPTRMVMKNYDKNSMTVIITHAMQHDVPIDDKYFNPTRFYK
jgi:hypothetical protein